MRVPLLTIRIIAMAAGLMLVCLTVSSSAQLTISIPNFPKKKKEAKPAPAPEPAAVSTTTEESTPTSSASSAPSSEAAASKPSSSGCAGDAFYDVWNEQIEQTAEDVKSFTPGRDYFVRDFNDNENKYLKMALSENQRKEYEEGWADDDTKRCVNASLDKLAALASKAIGSYTPVGYTLGTPSDKAALRAAVTDIGNATVFTVGIKDVNWKIVHNDIGIPTGRKKLGKLWVKYPGQTYCKIIWANVWQPYAGGGTYADSEGDFIAWEFAGCPAGK
jgi:hypothetical protein